jgi:hypothetical protein
MGDPPQERPDERPEPESKPSGGPPRPPKKTARALEDGAPGDDPTATMHSIKARMQATRILELLESVRGSRLFAINTLEAELDASVVELSELAGQLKPVERELSVQILQMVRDYRVRYPRATIPTYTGDPELREKAGRILHEIK